MEHRLPWAIKDVLILKKLLAHGAHVDTVDIYGNTSIKLLDERGIDVVKMEADSTTDLNVRNWHYDMSALAFAAKRGHAM